MKVQKSSTNMKPILHLKNDDNNVSKDDDGASGKISEFNNEP